MSNFKADEFRVRTRKLKNRVCKQPVINHFVPAGRMVTREEKIFAIKRLPVLKELVNFAYKYRQFNRVGTIPDYVMVANEIKSIRKSFRNGQVGREINARQQVLDRAEEAFKHVYTFEFASEAGVRGTTMMVRYMWGKKVYDRFYKTNALRRGKFVVLDVQEMIINDPNLRLFRCKAYNRRDGEVQDKYIGQSRLTKAAAIGATPQTAARSALHRVDKYVDNMIIKGRKEK